MVRATVIFLSLASKVPCLFFFSSNDNHTRCAVSLYSLTSSLLFIIWKICTLYFLEDIMREGSFSITKWFWRRQIPVIRADLVTIRYFSEHLLSWLCIWYVLTSSSQPSWPILNVAKTIPYLQPTLLANRVLWCICYLE